MRILLWHGYLLTGSGSNLYTKNVSAIWRRQGHDVLLMCQETDISAFDFIDEAGHTDANGRIVGMEPTGAPAAAGCCRLLRPDIGSLLPVYVYDEYEGFVVKRFVDLSDRELHEYTERNVSALVSAISEHRPEAVITGHEVMGPYVAKLACERERTGYLAKLHGSALEYAVRQQERYRRFASEGLNAAHTVVGGSRYMVEAAAKVIPGWSERAHVVNPGCDVDLFRPRPETRASVPTVGFVGKLIPSKGVHNLLVALGRTRTRPLKAVIVGFGGSARFLMRLWAALRAGDLDSAAAIALNDDERPHEAAAAALRRGGADMAARFAGVEVVFTGRLEHGPLSELLPSFDVLVVPSELPEAFGMVAAEGAACGVLPIVPKHSGIGEVGAALEEATGRAGAFTFDPQQPIEGIAERVDELLSLGATDREILSRAVAAHARSEWSWVHVADRLLALAVH